MRYSRQREVIKEIVLSTKTHPNADWVFNEAKKVLPNISLGTVYRNLKQLESRGCIKTIFDGSVSRYDCNRAPHNHLKCRACGDLVDIETLNIEIPESIFLEHDFKVEQIDMIFTGICNKH